MLTKALELFKLLLDPETRRSLSIASTYLGKDKKKWKSGIKSLSAKFRADEAYKLSDFLSFFLQGLDAVGVPREAKENCRIVLGELAVNAFEHGCQHFSSGWVKIKITYSPWFIRFEVTDSGKGFNLTETLKMLENKPGQRGLQVVRNLCYDLRTNRRGNKVVAFVAAHGSLEISAETETWRGQTIAVVNISSPYDWMYIKQNWETLRHALREIREHRVLVNCLHIQWSTRRTRDLDSILKGLRQDGRQYALVIDTLTARTFDVANLRNSNIEVFSCKYDSDLDRVKDWLVKTNSSDLTVAGLMLKNAPIPARRVTDDSPLPAYSKLNYRDGRGLQTFLMTKEEIVIGREAPDVWVDLRLDVPPDVSREHIRIQRISNGHFRLKDLSKMGTTIDGVPVPKSLIVEEGAVTDLDCWMALPDKAQIGLANCIVIDFEKLS